MIAPYLGRPAIIAHKAIEEAKLLFYHERLRDLHESDKIWKDQRNLGLCTSGLDTPSIFTTKELNTHFSSISSDPSAFSVSKFLEGVADEDSFPHFSFSEVTLSEVKLAMKRSEFILDIFNKSIRESVFPSIWKKSLVLALNKQHLILSAISGLLRCYASYRKYLRG